MKAVLGFCGKWTFALAGSLALSAAAFAASASDVSHDGMPMPHDMPAAAPAEATAGTSGSQPAHDSPGAHAMDMGEMQGGAPPPDARDPDAYADGLRSGAMPGMDMVDQAPYGMLLIDQLEYGRGDDAESLNFNMQASYGNDYDKLWLKVDGANTADGLAATRTEALWDHAIAAFWSTQLGLRHDFGDGPGSNWLALGVQGLAPHWFDVEATLYFGEAGRSAARMELEYDLLLTQRLILQPSLEFNLYGKSDPAQATGEGLADAEFGLRLRYEINRQFAPYLGVSWARKFGETADRARDAGDDVREHQWLLGVRMWF